MNIDALCSSLLCEQFQRFCERNVWNHSMCTKCEANSVWFTLCQSLCSLLQLPRREICIGDSWIKSLDVPIAEFLTASAERWNRNWNSKASYWYRFEWSNGPFFNWEFLQIYFGAKTQMKGKFSKERVPTFLGSNFETKKVAQSNTIFWKMIRNDLKESDRLSQSILRIRNDSSPTSYFSIVIRKTSEVTSLRQARRQILRFE